MYNIQDLGVHNPFLIKTMKNDLRYFKDAGVDTIIPLHYRFFQMQRTFKSFFNFHKIRFHDFSFIERSFEKVYEKIAHQKTENTLEYSLDIYSNQSEAFFLQEKKLLRTVTR
ncbi:hypothetical protein IJM86_07180 [bacterium]|nr:hypothetical protein [bacterium]